MTCLHDTPACTCENLRTSSNKLIFQCTRKPCLTKPIMIDSDSPRDINEEKAGECPGFRHARISAIFQAVLTLPRYYIRCEDVQNM